MTGITWTGQVQFTDSSDVGTTGVATLTLTPSCGVSNLPALAAGTPGLPPVLRNVYVTQVASGTTPSASTWTLVDPGGSGTASTYDLNLYVNKGADGAAGPSTAVLTAPDVEGPAILPSGWSGGATNLTTSNLALVDKYMLAYNATDQKMQLCPQNILGMYQPTYMAAYSGNAAQATLCTLSIPAQPFAWRPLVLHGYAQASGTVNTKVEIQVLLNNATTGDRVARGIGMAGTATPPPIIVGPSFGSAITTGSSYGVVAAGTAASIYMVAKQTASTTDSWSVSADSSIVVAAVAVP